MTGASFTGVTVIETVSAVAVSDRARTPAMQSSGHRGRSL